MVVGTQVAAAVGRSAEDCQAKVYEGLGAGLCFTPLTATPCVCGSGRQCPWLPSLHTRPLLSVCVGADSGTASAAGGVVGGGGGPLGGKGTTKRTRQLREYLQQQQAASDEDDVFEPVGQQEVPEVASPGASPGLVRCVCAHFTVVPFGLELEGCDGRTVVRRVLPSCEQREVVCVHDTLVRINGQSVRGKPFAAVLEVRSMWRRRVPLCSCLSCHTH